MERFDIKSLNENIVRLLDDEWALVTAGTLSAWNTMTISWGGMGVLWNKPVFTAYIRPTRHTFSFMEKNPGFSVSFFDSAHRQTLEICGGTSGRNTDKAKAAGITALSLDGTISFAEARMVFACKTLYSADIDPSRFIDGDIDRNYPLKDYHRMYIGEIEEAWKQ